MHKRPNLKRSADEIERMSANSERKTVSSKWHQNHNPCRPVKSHPYTAHETYQYIQRKRQRQTPHGIREQAEKENMKV